MTSKKSQYIDMNVIVAIMDGPLKSQKYALKCRICYYRVQIIYPWNSTDETIENNRDKTI